MTATDPWLDFLLHIYVYALCTGFHTNSKGGWGEESMQSRAHMYVPDASLGGRTRGRWEKGEVLRCATRVITRIPTQSH